jgi:hypothetical protein
MRIPILYIPKTRYKKFLHFEKGRSADALIIPIGQDCHPAYTLQELKLRTTSYPFDWLNTEPRQSIAYVLENIRDGFLYWISDLTRNENDYVISKRYPYVEFMHQNNLIENASIQEKFRNRAAKFLRAIKKRNVYFLHNLSADALKNESEVEFYIETIRQLTSLFKNHDRLYLYIRFDESETENKVIVDLLLKELEAFPSITTAKYIRLKQQYGAWGNPDLYQHLYNDLGIKTRETYRVYIK